MSEKDSVNMPDIGTIYEDSEEEKEVPEENGSISMPDFTFEDTEITSSPIAVESEKTIDPIFSNSFNLSEDPLFSNSDPFGTGKSRIEYEPTAEEISSDIEDHEEEESIDAIWNRENQTILGYPVDEALSEGYRMGASDVILKTQREPVFIVMDETVRSSSPKFSATISKPDLQEAYDLIISKLEQDIYIEDWDLDTAYVIKKGPYEGRKTRLNLVHTDGGNMAMFFRLISKDIPTMEELGIEDELKEWIDLPNGLILVNGPTGSGKSTTMASLLNHVKENSPKNIVTIEQPVEYEFPPTGRGFITQRSVGNDVKTWERGIISALRDNPRIIMIGEIRSEVEMSQVLAASDSGHLVVSTLHSNSAAQTLDRIMKMFSGNQGNLDLILSSLSGGSRGFANQTLVKTKDRKSRIAIREILDFTDPRPREFIKRGDVDGLRSYMRENKLTMEQKLAEAIVEEKVDPASALESVQDRHFFNQYYKELTGEDFSLKK